MGKAHCKVQGFIAATEYGQTKGGKPYFSIRLCCGKSEKDEQTGQYDNSRQQWWKLTAFGDYAQHLQIMGLVKGDAIVAQVDDPTVNAYISQKTNQINTTICGTMWNHTLAKVYWLPKNGGVGASIPEAPPLEEMDDCYFESLDCDMSGSVEIPF